MNSHRNKSLRVVRVAKMASSPGFQHYRPPQLDVEVGVEDHQVVLVDHQVDPRVQSVVGSCH